MLGISQTVPVNDQPIGHTASATIFGEDRWLTSWVTPKSLEIQALYSELSKGLTTRFDKVKACLSYVSQYPYTPFIRVELKIDGKKFVQEDAWLSPGEAAYAPKLNCANRAFLLCSLLRQEFSTDETYVVMGNLNIDGQNGHAWNYLKMAAGEYFLDSTALKANNLIFSISGSRAHQAVFFFNDNETRIVPGIAIREPFSSCWCIPFLEEYLDKRSCYNL